MIKPSSLSDGLLFTTTRIAVRTRSGETGTGTGFFYSIKDGDRTIPILVTNKHVVHDAEIGELCIQCAESGAPSGGYCQMRFDRFDERWVHHPSDTVDLCALPIAELDKRAKLDGLELYRQSFSCEMIQSDAELLELRAMEDVTMVGYPIGLWDEVNNLPLLRRGITSTHPGIDYRGEPYGVIDAACFPGSSGSPILILNEGVYGSRHGMSLGTRAILIGVLFAGPCMAPDGSFSMKHIPLVNDPQRSGPMVHLGYYVKARELLTLAETMKAVAASGKYMQ